MKVAIQLYSVRQSMAKDPIATIRKVADIGYKNIEVANHAADRDPGVGFAVSVEEMKKLLDETGAKVMGGHIMPLTPQSLPAILEYYRQIGAKYVIVPIEFYKNLDGAMDMADRLNKIGVLCKEAGIQLVYHNHFHEYQHFGKKTVLDMLVENTDPELVKFEIDTYWAFRAGQDPVAVLKHLGRRVCLIHQKDYTRGKENEANLLSSVEENGDYVDMQRFVRDMNEDTFTEIGAGILNIQGIIDAGNDYCGAEYIVLEQDYSQIGEFESIRTSFHNFHSLSGIEWS
jgi:sugar phosphate isomerase/epimerase